MRFQCSGNMYEFFGQTSYAGKLPQVFADASATFFFFGQIKAVSILLCEDKVVRSVTKAARDFLHHESGLENLEP